MTLVPDGDLTRVQIAAQAEVGGMIARVGQRLLEGVARTMMIGSTRASRSRWNRAPVLVTEGRGASVRRRAPAAVNRAGSSRGRIFRTGRDYSAPAVLLRS